jgi:transcriptional regulator with GAF, ATPase, and Fis domain
MDKRLRDLIEIVDFTSSVAVKVHGVLDEHEIYRAVKDAFVKSKRYDASVLLCTDDGRRLQVVQTSLPHKRVKAAESATGLRLEGYHIELTKSSLFRQVVREGRTLMARSSDVLTEWLPRPLADSTTKIIGYEKRSSILTPLRRHDRIIGALAMNCAAPNEYVSHSVKNLAFGSTVAFLLAEIPPRNHEKTESSPSTDFAVEGL